MTRHFDEVMPDRSSPRIKRDDGALLNSLMWASNVVLAFPAALAVYTTLNFAVDPFAACLRCGYLGDREASGIVGRVAP